MRAKCALGKLQGGILRISGLEGEKANMNEVFRFFVDIFKKLQNCNFLRRYGAQLVELFDKKINII